MFWQKLSLVVQQRQQQLRLLESGVHGMWRNQAMFDTMELPTIAFRQRRMNCIRVSPTDNQPELISFVTGCWHPEAISIWQNLRYTRISADSGRGCTRFSQHPSKETRVVRFVVFFENKR